MFNFIEYLHCYLRSNIEFCWFHLHVKTKNVSTNGAYREVTLHYISILVQYIYFPRGLHAALPEGDCET